MANPRKSGDWVIHVNGVAKMQMASIVRLFLRREFQAAVLAIGLIAVSSGTTVGAAAGKPKVPPGFFPWQFPTSNALKTWKYQSFNTKRWWGDFPHNLVIPKHMFKKYSWAIGPFIKYAHNPVLSPTPGEWDCGHLGGGVHNGAIIFHHGIFYYIYRGERPYGPPVPYICDIGIATSPDGIHFKKLTTRHGLFRQGRFKRYSYEDVCVAKYHGTYYLFCNQWYWKDQTDKKINGEFEATSRDLIHWKRLGILFPHAHHVYRNGAVVVNPHNRAVRIDGKFVMYLDNGRMAYSRDMIHWKTADNTIHFPGGETCFALADYDASNPNNIILFTGGNFTGNFYAIGEVLLSKKNLTRVISYLPKPVLAANPDIPYEHGFSATDPRKLVSTFADCIFFTGLTRHAGKWRIYYGGSEYYTCLATAPARPAGVAVAP